MKTCICNNCNKSFEIENKEFNRKIKKNTPFYCSRTCFAIVNNKKRDYSERMATNIKGSRIKSDPFKFYIKVCKQRNKENNLSLDYLRNLWISQKGICPYTKVNLVLNSHLKNVTNKDIRYLASIDRIDPSKGYIEGNVQFTSTAINYMKHSMSMQDTIEFLQIIKKNV